MPGQRWGDLTEYVLKFRNGDDTDWCGLFPADSSQKLWFYRNTAMDGFVVDTNVTDKVVALKGGSTYVSAGVDTQGSYGMDALAHTHEFLLINDGDNQQDTFDSDGNQVDMPAVTSGSGAYKLLAALATPSFYVRAVKNAYTGSCEWTQNTWRPAAAVGTLQILDFT